MTTLSQKLIILKTVVTAIVLTSLTLSGRSNALTDERLPDGEIAVATINGSKISAWYGSPTTRYRHGILGDAVEAGSLHVQIGDGEILSFHLPETEVFEDRTPRLADLNGDGAIEIITIRSYLNAGGSVAVFGIRDGRLTELAGSRPIGRANRWLNIAGIADFTGSGTLQIAYVETPHIGGTLTFLEWRSNELVPVASMPGFSNHKIGSREQGLTGSMNYTGNGYLDLVVPSDDLRTLRIVGFEDGTLIEFNREKLSAKVLKNLNSADGDQKCVTFELTNGQTVEICPITGR
ncbi:MAG: hypothetical protein ABJY83_23855 [Roseibium sp.]